MKFLQKDEEISSIYSCEYAKSDRSVCKKCSSKISMSILRLAIHVQSPFFDGRIPNWYHFECFFSKVTPQDPTFIKGYETLRWEDQQRIKKRLGLPTVTSSDLKTDDSSDNSSMSCVEHYFIEYSKSNRSKCKKCEIKIEKDLVRIGIKGNKSGLDGYYHLECFSKHKNDLLFNYEPDDLEKEDKKLVMKIIGEPVEQKRKLEDDTVESEKSKKFKNENLEKEKLLKTQADNFWKLKDSLDKQLSTEIIKEILIMNGQNFYKSGRDDLLTYLCDAMIFGPLLKCPQCKYGQLVYRGNAYICSGSISEWTNCTYKTQEPERMNKFKIDKELKNEYSCLKKFTFKLTKRIFTTSLNNRNENLLKNLHFTSIGKLKLTNAIIKTLIEKHGGRFSSNIETHTVAVITNQIEMDKMNRKIKECESNKLTVIDETFLDELNETNELNFENLVNKYKLSKWSSDLKDKMKNSIKYETEKKTEHLSTLINHTDNIKIKLKLKGGAVVDPDSNLEDDGHVLCESDTNEPYSCVLGLVDINRGTNSYYKLQIIKEDNCDNFYLFRSWGRVGTDIGSNKIDNYLTKHDAIRSFCDLYEEKTGNSWAIRKYASKKPNKFYPLEMDYGDNKDEPKSIINSKNYISTSKLDIQIQNLIKLIFDVETMRRQMKEFEIDLNKMPLGKISTKQIKLAFNVLNDLNNFLDKKHSNNLILDASNRFYTLIPHDFGMRKPPLLDNQKIIKEKTDMLNNLLDIEIAYNILNIDSNSNEDPIDIHYNKLKCHIEVLDHETDEFKRLLKYVENTHAATHSSYKLVVEDIFKVTRQDESSRYEPYKSIHNRKLLWHGSRLTNFAGILSQGLRIAPAEAPTTGYMFGKGVYFADMVSKSANYCFTSTSSPTGLLLLCEVALGNMYEKTTAEYVTKLPRGKHSTKGCGRTAPASHESYTTSDGVEIPMGKGVDSNVKTSSLLYNEYIVYDVNQVLIKYLLRVKFVYNY